MLCTWRQLLGLRAHEHPGSGDRGGVQPGLCDRRRARHEHQPTGARGQHGGTLRIRHGLHGILGTDSNESLGGTWPVPGPTFFGVDPESVDGPGGL